MSTAPTTPESTNATMEADFTRELGLDRAVVRKARQEHLTEDEHYHGTAAGIALTAAGVDKLLAVLTAGSGQAGQSGRAHSAGASDAATGLPGAGNGAPAGAIPPRVLASPDGVEILEVVRVPRNPLLVLARPESAVKGTAPVVLKVPYNTDAGGVRSHFFKVGMRVRAKHLQGASWQYHGPRPRYAGDPRCIVPKPRPVSSPALTPAPQA